MLSKFKFADRTTTELCQHFKCTESYCNQCKKVHKYAQAVGRLNIFLKARVAWHVMSAHLHKKAGFLRADEAGERARAEGWDRVGIICADFRADAPRCCVVFGSPWWVEEKKSPCQRAAEGLTCGVVSYGRVGLCTVVVGVSGLASDCCLQQCVRVEAHHVDPQPVV